MTTLEMTGFNDRGPLFSRLGMGCWAVGGHGWGKVEDQQSIAALRQAFDMGVTFFDTADTYGLGKSETMLRKAMEKSLRSVMVATKGGVRWDASGRVWNDSSPGYMEQAVDASLHRLGLEHIPLYYIHKLDGETPIAEVMGCLVRLRDKGKIGQIGVSHFSVAQFLEARSIVPIRAVQVRLNLLEPESGAEWEAVCVAHNAKLVAWGALADGLLTGKFNASSKFGKDDHRSRMPDFQGEKFLENLRKIAALKAIAENRGVLLSQLALRWIMDKYEWACPLFGAKTASQVQENLGANGWHLSEKEMAGIDAALRAPDGRARLF